MLALEVKHFDTLARQLDSILEQRLLVAICRRLRHRLRTTDRLVALDNGRFRILLGDGAPGSSGRAEPWPHTAGLVVRLQQVFDEPFSIDGQTLHLMVTVTPVCCQDLPDCQDPH